MQGALSFSPRITIKFSPETSRFHRTFAISAAFVEAPAKETNNITTRKSGSLYEVLRINHNASVKEIKNAYRTLAKMYHPDVSASSMAAEAAMREFIEIREAYTTLSDPVTRREYDVALASRLWRRRWGVGYQEEGDCGVRAQGGYYSGLRWETDQCW